MPPCSLSPACSRCPSPWLSPPTASGHSPSGLGRSSPPRPSVDGASRSIASNAAPTEQRMARTSQERSAMSAASGYLDYSGRDDELSGGSRLIPIDTPVGTFRVWVKRTGNNPRLKVLLLHGGPGATHEYLEACDSFLPAAGVEYYYYDQLGSGFSDQPDEPSLWELDRFVAEVDQVRLALNLAPDNFVLYGHSWGGILAIEYALKHQRHLRGLVISNMMSSVPAYNAYAEQVLMPAMDQEALAEIKTLEAAGQIEDPRYMKLLMEQHYVHHVLRMPQEDWPDPASRGLAHINPAIYVSMQGPSELGISSDASLADWD